MIITDSDEHLFAGQRIIESFGELFAVPDQELLVGQHRLNGVEVDLVFDLARHQVLALVSIRRIDEPHPIGFTGVEAVDVVVRLGSGVDPPEVLPVGVFGHFVLVVDVAHQWAKACASGNVICAPNTKNLLGDIILLLLTNARDEH